MVTRLGSFHQCGGQALETYRERDLVEAIVAMSEDEICHFIQRERKSGRLSRAVRRLNDGALSEDIKRRIRAKEAIKKLGFI